MHRTEGANNVNGEYADGPPGTTVPPEHMNAIQDEIINVIEHYGIEIYTAETDTKDQLKDAIVAGIAASAAANRVPAGTVFSYAGATIPIGYLDCDGTAVSRTTYADLFTAIGVIYGNGDGTTTFNLPDYRGRFLRGQDDSAGIDPDAATRTDRGDGTGGDNVGSKQTDAGQGHYHEISYADASNTGLSGASRWGNVDSAFHQPGSTNAQTGTRTLVEALVSDGVNGAPRTTSETRPTNIYVKYMIKT